MNHNDYQQLYLAEKQRREQAEIKLQQEASEKSDLELILKSIIVVGFVCLVLFGYLKNN